MRQNFIIPFSTLQIPPPAQCRPGGCPPRPPSRRHWYICDTKSLPSSGVQSWKPENRILTNCGKSSTTYSAVAVNLWAPLLALKYSTSFFTEKVVKVRLSTADRGVYTPYKRWNGCTMEKSTGGGFLQELKGKCINFLIHCTEVSFCDCCHQMSDFKAKMHQIRFRLGVRPRPRWGSLQCSPDPLAGLKGPTSKTGEGMWGEEGLAPRLYIIIIIIIIKFFNKKLTNATRTQISTHRNNTVRN